MTTAIDSNCKRIVVLFLCETSLISSYAGTIVDLSGANLRDANLRDARLVNTSLGAQGFLAPHDEGTDLSGADLSGANLSEATVNEKQLDTVWSLEGATVPDGSTHD